MKPNYSHKTFKDFWKYFLKGRPEKKESFGIFSWEEFQRSLEFAFEAGRSESKTYPDTLTGSTFYFVAPSSEGGMKQYKCHILEVVDGGMVVYKYFVSRNQRWVYKVESAKFIEYHISKHNKWKAGKL